MMERADGVSLPFADSMTDSIDFASWDASSCNSAGPAQLAAALEPPHRRKRSRSPRDASLPRVAVRTRLRNKQSLVQTSQALAEPSAQNAIDRGFDPDIFWPAMSDVVFEALPHRQRYMKVYNSTDGG